MAKTVTFRGLAKGLKKDRDLFFERAKNDVRELIILTDQALVFGTPVDTGRARANWLGGIGQIPSDLVNVADDGSERATSAANATEKIVQLTSNYDITANDFFIVNNLPYIQRLNEGHSRQAPARFVETAIAQAVRAQEAKR